MIQSSHTYYRDERYHNQSEDRSSMDQHQSHSLNAKQNPLYRDPLADQHRRQHSYADKQQQQQQQHQYHQHHAQHPQQQHQSHPQQQQQQQQQQQHRQQQPYHPSQPHHSIQTAAAAVRQHSALAKSNEDHHHTTLTHRYAIPVDQPSDPSFTQRPYSRSFSGTRQHPQYSHAPVSPPISIHPQGGSHRLHHSVSAGHLVPAGYRSAPLGNSMPDPMSSKPRLPTGPVAPPPNNVKKKDPYATAWRTYSKIAEELDLLNPDGSLYPISKEAILKYLRHQSKRIKSSNLHWYVNGLKKHQENLGFPWDDIRYDDQVVALLKELTLNPVTIVHGGSNNSNNNGVLNGNNRNDGTVTTYGQVPDRQRQGSGGNTAFPPPQNNHFHAPPPTPIDTTTKIAGLSLSQSKIHSPSQPYPGSYDALETPRPSSGYNYEDKPHSAQTKQSHSNGAPRTQIYIPPTTKATSYHSAPIQLSSGHGQREPLPTSSSSLNQGQSFSPVISKSQQCSPMSSSEIKISSPLSTIASSTDFRHQETKVDRTGHLDSPTSPVDEMDEDFEAPSRNQSHEDQETFQSEYMDEEPSKRVALKRFASTGTLRNQSRASSISVHPYPRPSDHRQRDDQAATLSPRVRENEPGGGSLFFPVGSPDTASSSALQSRVSPLGPAVSIGSNSPASRNPTGGPIPSTPRHKRANGVVSSPISTVAAVIASAATAAAAAAMPSSPIGSGKQTVQFSEVAEVAQRLQTKYGNQCASHPWGCVEISEDFHLELTIKMYMDWAGLVASQRLSMDELPDLPEFRLTDRTGLSYSPPTTFIGGGTLKRMTSTPSTITMGSFSQHRTSTNTSLKSEELSPSLDNHSSNISGTRSSRFGSSNGAIRKHRSPSRSPIYGSSPKEGYLIESLMSRIGSPPPNSFLPSPPAMPYSHREGSVVEGGELSPKLKSSTLSSSGGLANSSGATRVRARRMASSPSLGQHNSSSSSSHSQQHQATSPPNHHLKRGNSYGMASPPSLPSRPQFMPPMPPVPPLPSSLKVLRSASGKQYVLKSGGGGVRRLKSGREGGVDGEADATAAGPGSILSNSTASSSPSEGMELSANEDEEGEATMMMVMDDGEEKENRVEDHRVRGPRPSRASAMSPSGARADVLDEFSSRTQPIRLYADKEDDTIMASGYIRDETRQEVEGEKELDGDEEEVERRGDGEDRGSERMCRRGEGLMLDPSLDSNNNNGSNSDSARPTAQLIGQHWGQQQQQQHRKDPDRLSGEEQHRPYRDVYFQSQSPTFINNTAWPSRMEVEFDEDMEADSEVEVEDEVEGRGGMHGSTIHHPDQSQHQQKHKQQFSRLQDSEASYDRGQEKEQDEEREGKDVSKETGNWEKDQTAHDQARGSLYFSDIHQHHQQHSRHHSNKEDRDEDKVEEVRMEFKGLHSSS